MISTFKSERIKYEKEILIMRQYCAVRDDLKLFLLLFLISVLNTFDSVFTKTILNYGGQELNPIVSVANGLWGDRIWTWKIVAVPGLLFLLYLLRRFKRVEIGIAAISYFYTAVALFQAFQYLSIAG